jgi:uncharacterized protein (DUF2267 family)
MDALLEQHPNWKLLSKTKLGQHAKRNGVSKKDFDAWYASNKPATNELFARPTRAQHKHGRIAHPPYSYQIDVVFMDHYKAANRGTCFLLIVEVNSRKAWAYVLKSKEMPAIVAAYEKFLKSGARDPWMVQGDDDFAAKAFRDANDKRDIPVVTHVAADEHRTSGDAMGILNSLVRTLRTLLEKKITEHDDPKWPKFLQACVDTYNETPHGSLNNGATPDEAYDDPDAMARNFEANAQYNQEHDAKVAGLFKVGDYVRVRLAKPKFVKGTTVQNSLEVYQVSAVAKGRVSIKSVPDGAQQPRAYKPNELVVVDKPTAAEMPAVRAEAAVRATRATRKLKVQEQIEPAPKAALEKPRATRPRKEPPTPQGEWVIDKVIKSRGKGANKEHLVSFNDTWESAAFKHLHEADVVEVLRTKGKGKRKRYLIRWLPQWIPAKDVTSITY